MFNLPNLITYSRLMAIIFGFWFYNSAIFMALLSLYVCFSDYLDGYIARKMNLTSDFGANLDHIADKIAAAFFLVAMAESHMIPFALAVVLLVRDYASDMLKTNAIKKGLYLKVSMAAKIKTNLMFIWVAVAYYSQSIQLESIHKDFMVVIALFLQWTVLFMSILSLFDYCWNSVADMRRKSARVPPSPKGRPRPQA